MSLKTQIAQLVKSREFGKAITLMVDSYSDNMEGHGSHQRLPENINIVLKIKDYVDSPTPPTVPSGTPDQIQSRKEVESARDLSNAGGTPDQIQAAKTAVDLAATHLASAYQDVVVIPPATGQNPPATGQTPQQVAAKAEMDAALILTQQAVTNEQKIAASRATILAKEHMNAANLAASQVSC